MLMTESYHAENEEACFPLLSRLRGRSGGGCARGRGTFVRTLMQSHVRSGSFPGRCEGIAGSCANGGNVCSAFSDGAILLKWDGDRWSAQTSGTNLELIDVFGFGPTSVWA